MTAQFSEALKYEGQEVSMCTQPLGDYFEFGGERPDFEINCTALWRGYIGTWEIIDNRLYLVGIDGKLKDGSEVTLKSIFPGFPDRVFAHWYTGELRIPDGKILEYVHMGYGSIYERDLLLTIEKGVLIDTNVRQNGISDDLNAPDGYGIGAMSTFSTSKDREEVDK